MSRRILNGITWGHSRGITPLLAGAQRFSELFDDVEIRWKKRSLQEFADAPLEDLTKQYDSLIIDHPWSGCAAATQCVLPLDEYLPADFLDDQAKNSVGCSHLSYYYPNLLPAMGRGYIRPRYNGYLHFQDHAGEPLFLYLMNGGSGKQVLETMNSIYKESLNNQTSHD